VVAHISQQMNELRLSSIAQVIKVPQVTLDWQEPLPFNKLSQLLELSLSL
jgi:hypothetical protein